MGILFVLVMFSECAVFASDVHLCLPVGDNVVRRRERLLSSFGEETIKPSRGQMLFENRPW